MENIFCCTGWGLDNGYDGRSHIQFKYLFNYISLSRHKIIPQIWAWRHIHSQHWQRVGPEGTKYSVSILWFISTQLTLTLLLNTKFKTALAETKRQSWVGEAGFKHSSARSTPLGWALFPISAFRAAPEVSCFLQFHLFLFLVCCECYYKFSTYHPKVYTPRI